MNNIREPITDIGVSQVAQVCGVSNRAVYKWLKNNSLPMTEFVGKTSYAKAIQKASKGKYKASDLLRISQEKLLAS